MIPENSSTFPTERKQLIPVILVLLPTGLDFSWETGRKIIR